MRRLLPLLTVLGSAAALGSSTAAADPGHTAPKITSADFTSPPVAGREATLRVVAHDDDGVIWNVQVLWGDDGFTQADTFCVQGREIGREGVVSIPHTFRRAGKFTVAAKAVSVPSCDVPTPEETSPEQHVDVTVTDELPPKGQRRCAAPGSAREAVSVRVRRVSCRRARKLIARWAELKRSEQPRRALRGFRCAEREVDQERVTVTCRARGRRIVRFGWVH